MQGNPSVSITGFDVVATTGPRVKHWTRGDYCRMAEAGLFLDQRVELVEGDILMGILAFLAQDGEKRFFRYANCDLRKDQQNDEVLAFVRFWKERTGKLPEELIFDPKLTTYPNLNQLNQQGVQFVTLRPRSPPPVADESTTALSDEADRTVHPSNADRKQH